LFSNNEKFVITGGNSTLNLKQITQADNAIYLLLSHVCSGESRPLAFFI